MKDGIMDAPIGTASSHPWSPPADATAIVK